MSHAVHAKNLSEWVTIRDPKLGFQISFPGKPIEMSFDLPFQNTPSKGNLHIYTVPLESGVFILSAMESEEVKDSLLKDGRFKECIDTFLVKHLFHEPHLFHQKQTFKSRKTEHNGLPLTIFQFSYWDGGQTQWMKGAALVKDGVLYNLIYLSPKEGYNNQLLEHFVSSFSI